MKQRIAFFSPTLGGGGAERVMLYLARSFMERGMAVDLVLAKASGEYLPHVPSGIRVVDLGANRVLTSLPHLVKYLRQEKTHAMLATQAHANVIALWAKRIAAVDTHVVVREANIVRPPSNSIPLRSHVIPFLARHSYRWADGIVAVSHGVAESISANYRLPLDQVNVIYNPVAQSDILEKAKSPVEHDWFASNECPVVISAGRLTPQKDFSTLIRAFALVRHSIQARLMIIGEGEMRTELEELIHELKLTNDVVLPGFVNNPYAYMKKAAVYVLSSAWEGMPNSLIEALAVGLPVVATDCVSGPSEILQEGKYGTLTPVGDTRALALGILEAIQRKRPVSENSAALNQFLPEVCLNKYMKALMCEPGLK